MTIIVTAQVAVLAAHGSLTRRLSCAATGRAASAAAVRIIGRVGITMSDMNMQPGWALSGPGADALFFQPRKFVLRLI